MSDTLSDSTGRLRTIGQLGDMTIQVIGDAPVESDVDLSILCLFEHEATGTSMMGGLLSFDQEIGCALTRLRAEGMFRGQEMETLYLPHLPKGILPRSAMVIGLGDPDSVGGSRLERAGRIAIREAVRLGATTVAFAPDILDAGIDGLKDIGTALLTGVVDGYVSETRLASLGLAPGLTLQTWTFNAGMEHLEPAEAEYKATFHSLQAKGKTGKV